MALLIDDSEQSTATIANLPNNQDVMKFISNFLPHQKTNRIGDITVNQLCVTVWLNEEDRYEWYIGYVKEIIKENYLADHLKREFRSSNKTWKYPTKSDEHVVDR